MEDKRKLASLGAFYVMWGLGIIFLGLLLVDPVGRRVVAGIGILFVVLGMSLILPLAIKFVGAIADD